jgi:hypothetical protein
MAIHDLVRKEKPHDTVTAVWFDSDEGNSWSNMNLST